MTLAAKLENFGIRMSKITNSVWYVVGVNAFVLLCWFLNLVFVGLIVFILVFTLVLLTQKNINAVMPFLISIVYMVSDTGADGHSAVRPDFLDAMLIVVYCFLPFLAAALVYFFIRNKKKLTLGSLFPALVVFFAAATLGGAGTELFTLQNVFTMLGYAAALIAVYLFFRNALDFTAEGFKRYFSFAFLSAAVVVSVEMFCAFIRKGSFNGTPYVGWGTGPAIAFVIAMGMPFLFYLITSSKSKAEFIAYHFAVAFFLAVIFLTNSRATLLAVGCGAIPLLIIARRKMTKEQKKLNLIILCGMAIVLLAGFAAFSGQIIDKAERFLKSANDDVSSGRFELWQEAWNAFKQSPIFGKSFFFVGGGVGTIHNTFDSGFLFYYWFHNTVIQITADMGLVGLAAFGYFLYKKYGMFMKKGGELFNVFILMSFLIVELQGMLDTHSLTFLYAIFFFFFMAGAEQLAVPQNSSNPFPKEAT